VAGQAVHLAQLLRTTHFCKVGPEDHDWLWITLNANRDHMELQSGWKGHPMYIDVPELQEVSRSAVAVDGREGRGFPVEEHEIKEEAAGLPVLHFERLPRDELLEVGRVAGEYRTVRVELVPRAAGKQ
jgi:hypothetical protein